MLVAQDRKPELEEITVKVCMMQAANKDRDWNPAYQWGIQELEIALGIRLPAMPDPDWSLEDIEIAQQTYEKLK